MTAQNPTIDWEVLFEKAQQAKKNAYAPYSDFCVGAAVLSKSGETFAGANVENVSFGLTICAERNAIAQAVSQGVREVVALVVVTDSTKPTPPCGMCRQVLAEFSKEAIVRAYASDQKMIEVKLAELLPFAFDHSFLTS